MTSQLVTDGSGGPEIQAQGKSYSYLYHLTHGVLKMGMVDMWYVYLVHQMATPAVADILKKKKVTEFFPIQPGFAL